MDWYRTALQAAYDGTGIDLPNEDLRVAFVDSGYTADRSDSGDEVLADVKASGTVLATTSTLTGVTWTGRTLDADDATIPDPGSGEATQMVLYIHTGSDATARLLGHTDTASGLPILFDGADDTLEWDANGILEITP